MSNPTRFAVGAAAIAMLLAGCASHTSSTSHEELSPAARSLGVYKFTERITATGSVQSDAIDLDGQFVVIGDTVTVDARPGPCYYDSRTTLAGPIRYQCGDAVTLLFDRQQPVLRASYSAQVKIRETTRTCLRYQVDASGRRVCAEWSTQTTERMVTQSGHLRTQRIQGEPVPPPQIL